MEGSSIKSAAQLFKPCSPSGNFLSGLNPKLFPHDVPGHHCIIELSGPYANALFLDFIVRSILPQELNSDFKGSKALYVNTQHHLNTLTLVQTMDAKLKDLQLDSKNRKINIEKALKNVYSMDCFCSDQFEMTMRQLGDIIYAKDDINLLIVDSIHPYFYSASANNDKLNFYSYVNAHFKVIETLARDMGLVVVFATLGASNPEKNLRFEVDYKIACDPNEFAVTDCVQDKCYNVRFESKGFLDFT